LLFCYEDFKQVLIANKHNKVIRDTLKSLSKITSLEEIPSPFNRLKYYQLLIKHQELVSEANEEVFISKFKEKCWEQTGSYCDFVEEEFTFLDAFVVFLGSKNLCLVRTHPQRFCNGDLTFKELIEKIMCLKVNTYGKELIALQREIEHLNNEEDLFSIDKIKEAIEAYIKPVELQIKTADNRLIIEVIGKNLVTSEILLKLNDIILSNPEIEEVRFRVEDIIHIDTNIEKEIWHGKNIIVCTNRIKVHNEVTWNVSGKDGEDYLTAADTYENGEGKQGADGRPGESGGNIWILAEEIKNPEKFTMISNGGQGGRGQDGGNGKGGKNGEGIKREVFYKKFPTPANFLILPTSTEKDGEEKKGAMEDFTLLESQRRTNVRANVKSIYEEAQTIETAWYSNASYATTNDLIVKEIIEDVSNIRIPLEDYRNKEVPVFTGNIFIKATTEQGNKITFSFEHGGGLTACQAFLLYEGSKGEPGGKGGECGLGGPGGYCGNIIIDNQMGNQKVVKSIINGENGNPGSCGSPGKDGWDRGYMDYSMSFEFLGGTKWPKILDNENDKIELRYHHQWSGRIYCPYQKHSGMYCKYAKLEPYRIKYLQGKEYEEKINTQQNSKRECQTRATHKKAILREEFLASYSSLLQNTLRNTLIKNIKSELEEIRNLQLIHQNKEKQETLNTELKIEHDAVFTDKNQHATFDTISNKQHVELSDDDSDSDLFEEYKLENVEERKCSQVKTEKGISNIRDSKDCLESAKIHADCAEDSNKCFLESVCIKQVETIRVNNK
jgi:hypothetical protein